MKGLPSQAPHLDLSATQIQLLKSRCSNSLRIALKVSVDPAVLPVVHPPRRVPEALREPLKNELVSLVEQGILAKVTEPTDWVNSLVCITKSNGALRLCLDP